MRTRTRQPISQSWARFVVQHAQSIVWIAGILLVALIPLARTATHHTVADGWLPATAEAVRVQQIRSDEFGSGSTTYFLVFTSKDGRAADDPSFVNDVRYAIRPLQVLPEIERVVAWGTTSSDLLNTTLIADDRMSSIAIVTMVTTPGSETGSPEWLRDHLGATDLHIAMTGLPVVGSDFREFGHNDLVRAELIALPITLGILLVVFRGVVPALLPVLTAAGSLVITLATMSLVGRIATVNVFTVNAVSMLGLAVGIDYALILVSRFREELHQHPAAVALELTLSHAGRTVVVAGSTVAIGLSGLFFFRVPAATPTALLGAVVVLAAVVMAVVVLPAVVILLSERLTSTGSTLSTLPGLPRIERVREQHPVLTIVLCTAVLVALAAPALGMRAVSPGITNLPATAESRTTAELVQSEFPQASTSPIDVVIQPTRGTMLGTDNLAAYRAVSATIADMPGVQRVETLWTFIPLGLTPESLSGAFLLQPDLVTASTPYLTANAARITVVPDASLDRNDREDLVRRIRSQLAANGPTDMVMLVGGNVALDLDLLTYVQSRIPAVLTWVFALTALALFVHLRSLLLPLKALVLNTLSMGASFGALVWIFQDGNLAGIVHAEADGTTVMLIPILMFCFLFGLGMDFEIIMLSRIREAWLQSGDTTRAVADGLQRAAGIVTASAVLMLAVFLSFGFGQLDVVKALGIGLAIAVMLDATVIRLLLLPATMQVMGRWNWWPSVHRDGEQ